MGQTPLSDGAYGRFPVVDARLLPPLAAGEPSESRQLDSAFTTVGMTATRGRRPWWLIPIVSAGSGAVLFEVARGDECEQSDCTIYIPPPVQGAVLGLVVGTVVEVVLRASGR